MEAQPGVSNKVVTDGRVGTEYPGERSSGQRLWSGRVESLCFRRGG